MTSTAPPLLSPSAEALGNTPPGPATTVLTDPVRLGNGHVLSDLVGRAARGRHTLLVGDEGVGKTRLLLDLQAVARGQRIALDPAEQRLVRRLAVSLPQGPDRTLTTIYVAEAGPPAHLVTTLVDAFHDLGLLALPGVPASMRAAACAELDAAEVRKLLRTTDERQTAIVESLHDIARGGRAPRLLIVLDALDRASPTQGLFLRELQRRATIIGAVRVVPQGRSLRTFFATFGQLPLGPLGDDHTGALFEYFVGRYDIACADRAHYRREVLRRAEGNPAILRAMMHDGAQSQVVSDQDVRDLQARDDAPFFNLGLIYVFFLIGLGAVRVLMIGTTDTDLYIVLTFVTILGYLVFRVFRQFFMFQPRADLK
ncbi:AAA family ATPase [Rubrivirga sp.]|uniref:AAA family ATPase n=1 Tax=Rubrivirga sp. TaxID=1885344 RepID=UPI003C731598